MVNPRFLTFLALLCVLASIQSCGTAKPTGVAGTPAPAGVNASLWRQLTAELERQLADPPRSTSAVVDQAQLTYDQGSSRLSWYMVHPGDYDQNGVVSVSDLTPLAVHFGAKSLTMFASEEFPHETIQSAVDGDGNGEITIADISPIAAHFGKQLSGYHIYQSASAEDNPEDPAGPNGPGAQLVSTMQISAATQTQGERKKFTVQVVPTSLTQYFWVRPFSGAADGAASNSVAVTAVGNFPPVAQLSAPSGVNTPARIDFDAAASFDPDGTVIQYEWDFEGDGVYDYNSGASAETTYYYYEGGEYNPVVRVTDDSGAIDTATVEVKVFLAEVWRETIISNVEENLPSTALQSAGEWVYLLSRNGNHAHVRSSHDRGNTWEIAQTFSEDPESSQLKWCGIWNGLPIAVVQKSGDRVMAATNESASAWDDLALLPLSNGGEVAFISDDRLQVIGHFQTGYQTAFFDLLNLSWEPVTAVNIVNDSAFRRDFRQVGDAVAVIELRDDRDLLYWRSNNAELSAWQEPQPLSNDNVAGRSRLLDMAGFPAVVYYDVPEAKLRFARALDTDGTQWEAGSELTNVSDGNFESKVIDGRPHVFYWNRYNGELNLLASNNLAGSTWAKPLLIADPGLEVSSNSGMSVADVQGHPALAVSGESVEVEGEENLRFYIFK